MRIPPGRRDEAASRETTPLWVKVFLSIAALVLLLLVLLVVGGGHGPGRHADDASLWF